MERISANGAEFEVEEAGAGEPLLLIHGGVIGDAYKPLLSESSLTSRYRVIQYHRRGYCGSSRPPRPFTIPEQAQDALAILRRVCGESAHVAGHSYGGVIGIQLALDAPEAVHSLALFEPAWFPGPAGQAFAKGAGPIIDLYQGGDAEGAVSAFTSAVLETDDWREQADRALPAGWYEQAIADADTLFEVELPALAEWDFTAEMAARIKQPLLAVLGGGLRARRRGPLFSEGHDLLKEWIPQAEPFILPDATHGLEYQNPRGAAEGLAAFLARHPIPIKATA
jgi:pimeloyl-ACP methyl ester carboxylesterase